MCDCPRQSLDFGFAARSTTPPTNLDNYPGSIEVPSPDYHVIASPQGRGNLLVNHSDRNHRPGDCHVASLLAMTVVVGAGPSVLHSHHPTRTAWAVPHALQNRIFLKKVLHFTFIRARICNVNIKSVDRVVVFSVRVLRESGAVGATQHGKQGFPPGAAV